MKFYIAGHATEDIQNQVLRIEERLHEKGHEVVSTWHQVDLRKNYSASKLKRLAINDLREVRKADAFILLYDKTLIGALIELGHFLYKRSSPLERDFDPNLFNPVFILNCNHDSMQKSKYLPLSIFTSLANIHFCVSEIDLLNNIKSLEERQKAHQQGDN